MNRNILFGLLIVSALGLTGCAPSLIVQNRTSFAVRVIIAGSAGTEVVSPSPGESSVAEMAVGSYRVTVIPDAEWIEYAKLTRKVLNDQLANSDQLTGPQLLEVIRRLKDIAIRMQQFEQAAASQAGCGGRISEDSGDGLVTISTASNGSLVASCR
ncbi:MAG: hypothetical protein HY327_13925 [Chloroflexi bacterium]|nr:hypothetical protein [Chloroflexota bacterium]